MSNLESRTMRAFAWNLTATVGNRSAQFVITILLARLLSPAEFGLVAMLTVFMAVASVVVESGYGSALIQRQDSAHVDESSVFLLNIAVAICLYVLFWFAAIPIAAFYGEPSLVPISRVLALVFICNALGLIQSCLCSKRLDFKTLGKANILSTILSGAIGVAMAARGYGVWSLVTQSVSNAFLYSALLWLFSSWRPTWEFSLQSVRSMFRFGSSLLFSGLISTVFDNLYPLCIGKLFSEVDLGYYSRALTTQRLPTESLSAIIGNVAFPAYATMQKDRALLRKSYRRTIIVTSMIAFPLMSGLLVAAGPLFAVLFSEKWLPSVPYFRVLCMSGALYHLHSLNMNILKASGRSDLLLRVEIVKRILVVAGLLLTFRFGIMAMIWGQVITSAVSLFVNTYYTGILINYGIRHQLSDVWVFAALSAAAMLAAYLCGSHYFTRNECAQLVLMAASGASIYLGLAYLLNAGGTVQVVGRLLAYAHGYAPTLRSRPRASDKHAPDRGYR